MMYIIFLSAIVLLCSFFNYWVNCRRQIHFNEMNLLYDKMELYAYEHDLQNDKTIVTYLLPFQNFVVNNGFADIQTMLILFLKEKDSDLKKKRAAYDNLLKTIPEDLKLIGKEFDKNLDRAIKLSSYRAEFILFFIFQFFRILIKSIFWGGLGTINKLFRSFDFVTKNENILIQPRYTKSEFLTPVTC